MINEGLYNGLKIKTYKYFNNWYFRYKKIQFGENLQVYNKVYITGKIGRITIGNNFYLTSGDGINPICRNIRGCIHTECSTSKITIGNHVGMSSPCIWIRDSLTIGNHVRIGGNCLIMDTDTHQIDYLARRRGRKDTKSIIKSAPITIEDDVWIGANCQILKGVTIGARSIIGAGSVVTRSIPADCIAAGNPCRVIKAPNSGRLSTLHVSRKENEKGIYDEE